MYTCTTSISMLLCVTLNCLLSCMYVNGLGIPNLLGLQVLINCFGVMQCIGLEDVVLSGVAVARHVFPKGPSICMARLEDRDIYIEREREDVL